MKSFALSTSILVLLLTTGIENQFIPPVQQQQQRQQGGLGFSASVEQAKQQIRYLFAGEKPVKESIDKIEDYYMDIEEKDMRKLHPKRALKRPACKILPDPQPGLVNPLLVEPTHTYKPLLKDEQFFGEFAPPVSYQFVPGPEGNSGAGVNGSSIGTLPPLKESFGLNNNNSSNMNNLNNLNNPNILNPNAKPAVIPVPFPVIQKETVYAPNPFYGYKDSDYNAASDYFQKLPKPTRNIFPATPVATAGPSPTTQIAITPTFYVDNSDKMASMSAALAANSAALASISYSLQIASLNSVWSVKEESLRSKLADYSATATATATTTKSGWTW